MLLALIRHRCLPVLKPKQACRQTRLAALPCLNPMTCVFSITARVAGRSLSAIPCLVLSVPRRGAPSLAKLSAPCAFSYTCRSEVAVRPSSASMAQRSQCHHRSEFIWTLRSEWALTRHRRRPNHPLRSKPFQAARLPFQVLPPACPPAAQCGRHLPILPAPRR